MSWIDAWQALYGDSALLSTAITTLHLLALLLGGGLAIAADRATLRAAGWGAGARTHHLRELDRMHPPVVVALATLFLTGAMMAAADLERYLAAPAFWVKMALVALLLANGGLLVRYGRQLIRAEDDLGRARLWRRMRAGSVASLTLWAATLIAGEVLVGLA